MVRRVLNVCRLHLCARTCASAKTRARNESFNRPQWQVCIPWVQICSALISQILLFGVLALVRTP